jgi:hypothetical protein
MAAMPLDTISGAGCTASREAGVTLASLESVITPEKNAPGSAASITRCGGRASANSSGWEGCGQTSTPFSLSNTKGRPWAAEVENTAEDINSSEDFREHRSREAPQALSLFIRL